MSARASRPTGSGRLRWPWWAFALLAVAAVVGYAVAVRHAAVLGGLLAAGLLAWAAEHAEAAWRTRPGASLRSLGRPARAPGLVVWLCVLAGLAVIIWPHLVP